MQKLSTNIFEPSFGSIIAEVRPEDVSKLSITYTLTGQIMTDPVIEYREHKLAISEAVEQWKKPLEKVFPSSAESTDEELSDRLYEGGRVYVCKNRIAKPSVFIPVFPGTNCEYDSAKAFEKAGASVITSVFRNLSAEDIRDSVLAYKEAIDRSQIIMFPGGFSAGDEPDGSAKFFATAFRNEVLKDAVMRLLNERDGLILGVCNGFQALIKLGLVPFGEIREQEETSPTLTFNTINRHISKMIYTKVISDKSPWLAKTRPGETYVIPASHGEGRFVAPEGIIEKLFENGQVATRYADSTGRITMDSEYNVNGSFMAIEGITSPDGRCFGRMGHPERRGRGVAVNICGEQDMKIFEAGVEYFR